VEFGDYAQGAVRLANADLSDLGCLQELLGNRAWLVTRARAGDLAPLRRLQGRLDDVVDASAAGDAEAVVEALNGLLARHPVRPRISGHDTSDWHLHVTEGGSAVAEVLAAEALLGLALLVTERGADRLGRCRAAGCRRAFVDLTSNRTRQFCSSRCATRTNVAAYRRRQRTAGSDLGLSLDGRDNVDV
jgi:predicted RNA-binding Zn ribbon-like protein